MVSSLECRAVQSGAVSLHGAVSVSMLPSGFASRVDADKQTRTRGTRPSACAAARPGSKLCQQAGRWTLSLDAA